MGKMGHMESIKILDLWESIKLASIFPILFKSPIPAFQHAAIPNLIIPFLVPFCLAKLPNFHEVSHVSHFSQRNSPLSDPAAEEMANLPASIKNTKPTCNISTFFRALEISASLVTKIC